MVEEEKITTENISLPEEEVVSTDTEIAQAPDAVIETQTETAEVIPEIKTQTETAEVIPEIKTKEPNNNLVVDASFSKEQQADFNKLLKLEVDPKEAKAIVTKTSENKSKKTDFSKSEYEVDKEKLKNDGYDLDLIIKTKPKAIKSFEELIVDDVGVATKTGYVSKKDLFELKGIRADKDNEIKGSIRYELGFGLKAPQYETRNIKNLLIKRIKQEGNYDEATIEKFKDKIEVKNVPLEFRGEKSEGIIYRIPKELGGDNMFSAVDSPKISGADFSDAVADAGPIVASIVGGTIGSSVGPLGTVAGSAVSGGLTEYARLMYGYHKLGLQNDEFTPEEFQGYAIDAAKTYAAIDAAATGVFLTAAKLILPTILGKSQLSTNTIKEFIETKGRTNTGVFKEVDKVKEQMKKEFNLTDEEASEYFAVSVGKAILDSDQLIKKGSAAQRALLSDEVVRLETSARFKAIEDKILKQTTNLGEIGNKQADDIIKSIETQVRGQAGVAIKEAELALINNTKLIAKMESSFVDDLSTKYLDEFGVQLDDTYRAIQTRLSTLDDNIATGISKDKEIIKFDIKETLDILRKEVKTFSFKGILPSKLKPIVGDKGKKLSPEKLKEALENNKLVKLSGLFSKIGFQGQGTTLKTLLEGFKVLEKKPLTLKDVYTLKNAVNFLQETTTNSTTTGALRKLSGQLNKNIYNALSKSKDQTLAKEFLERNSLLGLKRNSIFKNFSDEFGGGQNIEGLKAATSKSESLFKSTIDDTIEAREKSRSLGQLIERNIIPESTVLNIKQALYRNYFNNVVPDASGIATMSHKDFFKKFGKNYENVLGKKDFIRLKNTESVLKQYDELAELVTNQNAAVQKYLPGIGQWDALSNAGPGQIVEHIIRSGAKSDITNLLKALPTKTVNDIRSIFLKDMMGKSQGGTYTTGANKFLGARKTDTLNGAKLNKFLTENRSNIQQMFDPNFFKTYRSIADVLEMLQTPATGSAAKGGMAEASKNAALFIDMIYGPLNHKRLILNRFSTLMDRFGLSQDNIFLLTDYAKFTEAAKKQFLGGNYPAFMDKLPNKERVTFIDKVLKAIKLDNTKSGKFLSKTQDLDSIINRLNFGFNRGAGLRKTFNKNPLKNPLVAKEYLKDKGEEIKGTDPMQREADIFSGMDISAKYAIKSLEAVFVDTPVAIYKDLSGASSRVKSTKARNLDKENFEKEYGSGQKTK